MGSSLDELLSLLADGPPLAGGCRISRSGAGAMFQRGGTQAGAKELTGGLIEILYEAAPHVPIREQCTPRQAAEVLRRVFERDHL